MVRRNPPAVLLAQKSLVPDAEQNIVGGVHIGGCEIDIIGRHQRRVHFVGPGHQPWLRGGLTRRSVPLQLDIKAIAKGAPHGLQRRPSLANTTGGEQGVDRTIRTAGQKDQALGMGLDQIPGHARRVSVSAIKIGGGRQHRKVQIARLVLGQQHDGRRPRPALGRALPDPRHGQGAPDDWLNTRVLGDGGKFKGPKEIGPISQGHGRHFRPRRQRPNSVRLNGAFQQGVGRANPQVNEPHVAGPVHSTGHVARLQAYIRLTPPNAPPNISSIRSPPPTQTPSHPEPAEPSFRSQLRVPGLFLFRFCSPDNRLSCGLAATGAVG